MKQIRRKYIFYGVVLLIFFSNTTKCYPQSTGSYLNSINNWHKQRIAELTSAKGWLNLEGLFWLHAGSNSFGSAPGNDIIYKHPEMPAMAGTFLLDGKQVFWQSAPGILVKAGDQEISKSLLFHPDSLRNPAMQLGSFSWTIIRREEKIGVRFRDLKSSAVKNFAGIDRFPTDSNWKVAAKLVPSDMGGIAVTNVLGQTKLEKSPGQLRFIIAGKTYSLDALDEGGEQLFIVFGDATNGESTYHSGRFIYVLKPDIYGQTEIDFNKAINPPCAFTDFATCPIPPKQNVLPITVTAGEKIYASKSK
jgi:hypothetical protein